MNFFSGYLQTRQQKFGLTEEAESALCRALHVSHTALAKDVINALILSECVYKLSDIGVEGTLVQVRAFQQQFPPQLVSLRHIQTTLPHVSHRYLIAATPEVLYVSFIGTKQARDVLVDADLLHSTIWQVPDVALKASPAAHRGFLARARGIPAEELLAHALATNRRLVLCGHSLGGAVAVLCTLRLLQQFHDQGSQQAGVQCITFGTPAIGNAALARKVESHGWKDLFHNVILPEDLVPWLLAFNPGVQSRPATQVIAESESSSNREATGNGGQAEQGRAWPQWVVTALPHKLKSSRFLGGWGSTAEQIESPGGHAVLGPRQHLAQAEGLREGGSAAPHAEARDNGEVDAATSVASSQPWWNKISHSGHNEGCMSEDVARQQDDASVSNVKPAIASRVSGAVSSVARRLPGWGAGPREQGSAESRGPDVDRQVEEGDDAVDALLDGPASAQGSSSSSADGPEVEGSPSWLQRLGRLQALASYAASGVRNARQLLPTFVHFGRSMTWDMPPGEPLSAAVPVTTSDLRSRLLASHRMQAYRTRAAALCVSVGAPVAQQRPAPKDPQLSDSILPKLIVSNACARLEPLQPQLTATEQRGWGWRWSRGALTSSTPRGEGDAVRMRVAVEGEGLAFVRGARMQAADGSLFPARVLEMQGQPSWPLQHKPEDLVRKGPFQWLREVLAGPPAKSRLIVEATIPAPAAAQVYSNAAGASQPKLILQLRSDFAQERSEVDMHLPSVWFLAQTPNAADSLMSSLLAHSRGPSNASNRSSQPHTPATSPNTAGIQEILVDGVRWRNLLATQCDAMQAIHGMIPALLRMQPGKRVLARLHSLLPTASAIPLDALAANAIVVSAETAVRQATQAQRLMVAAQGAGVPVVIIAQEGSGADMQMLASCMGGHREVQVLPLREGDGGGFNAQDILALRGEINEALSADSSQPRSRL